jgi:hypothetical protein
VNALIDKANELWDERNAKAVAEGEEELEHMLPLIRLKVHFLVVVILTLSSLAFFLGRHHGRERDVQPNPLWTGVSGENR